MGDRFGFGVSRDAIPATLFIQQLPIQLTAFMERSRPSGAYLQLETVESATKMTEGSRHYISDMLWRSVAALITAIAMVSPTTIQIALS